MTSQSIEGNIFTNYEILDSKIAPALKKNISSVHFRRRVSVEEQRARKCDRSLRERQVAYMIYEYFRATAADEAVQGLSDLFRKRLHDDAQEFNTRRGQAPLAASEIQIVLEGLYKSKIRESVQLLTVLTMYDQEIDRHLVLPSYQRLKTMVRRCMDPKIRARNFEANAKEVKQEYW